MTRDGDYPPPQSAGDPWHIASPLLHNGGTAWSNLGLWPLDREPREPRESRDSVRDGDPDQTEVYDYVTACQALAHAVGEAAHLQQGVQILDVACGYGASLAYWPPAFGVARVDAVEKRTACIEEIRRHRPPHGGMAWVGDGQNLTGLLNGSKDGPKPHSYDAILCVDAAYHFGRPQDFFAGCAALLKSGGYLAWTTLTRDPKTESAAAAGPSWTTALVQRLAQVPPSGILTVEETQRTLQRAGLSLETTRHLDGPVMAGFARFVAQRRRQLSPWQRCSLGWWKIAGTARLCQSLHHSGTWHYTLFAAKLS